MALLTDKDLLARLVAFDSVSARPNAPIAGFVRDYLERAGARVEWMPDDAAEKVNIVATIGPEPQTAERGLVLSGHLDVVPADEPNWQSDPFTLDERNGCYFGRGSCDMKGFVALAMNAMCEMDAAALRSPLTLILTHDEEVGSLGAKRFTEEWPRDRPLPRAVIIGEPTSLRAVRMHKGHLSLTITCKGQSAHSGSPHLGANAIEPMGAIIQRLRNLRIQFEAMRTDTSEFFDTVPYPVLNCSMIEAGTAVNVVPDRCMLTIGVRLMPGQIAEQAVEKIRASIQDANRAADDVHIDIELGNENPTLLTDEHAPIHRMLCEELQQTKSYGVSYGSDGGWLSTLGMDCVLFGPGTIEVAHRPNEYVPIDEFIRCRDMLRILIERFCR